MVQFSLIHTHMEQVIEMPVCQCVICPALYRQHIYRPMHPTRDLTMEKLKI